MTWKLPLFLIMLLPLYTCTGHVSSAPQEEPQEFYSIKNAEQLAQKNIQSGNLYLLTFGEEMRDPHRDPETGLKIESIGCVGDETKSAYIEAYNKIIRDHIKKQ